MRAIVSIVVSIATAFVMFATPALAAKKPARVSDAQLVADLGHAWQKKREVAEAELKRRGESAVPALRAALDAPVRPDVEAAIVRILDKTEPFTVTWQSLANGMRTTLAEAREVRMAGQVARAIVDKTTAKEINDLHKLALRRSLDADQRDELIARQRKLASIEEPLPKGMTKNIAEAGRRLAQDGVKTSWTYVTIARRAGFRANRAESSIAVSLEAGRQHWVLTPDAHATGFTLTLAGVHLPVLETPSFMSIADAVAGVSPSSRLRLPNATVPPDSRAPAMRYQFSVAAFYGRSQVELRFQVPGSTYAADAWADSTQAILAALRDKFYDQWEEISRTAESLPPLYFPMPENGASWKPDA